MSSGVLASALAFALLAPGGAGLAAQQEVTVEPGDRLVVENLSGSLLVRGWDEAKVRFEDDGEHSVVRRGGRVTLGSSGRGGRMKVDGGVLRIPRTMSVHIQGLELDVGVEDVNGEVEVHTVEGDLEFRRTGGSVRARTVDGEIRVERARGSLSLSAQADDITVDGQEGESLEAMSASGDLTLRGVDVLHLDAETVDGDVTLDGVLRSGGHYRLSVHDGDAEVTLPMGAGVRGRMSTFDGDFVSDIPLAVRHFEGGESFEFLLGDGGAELDVQVFDGEIRLVAGR